MMPRTIDTMRARLPGGDLGQYQLSGPSSRLLDEIGVNEADLQEVVARARTDDDVAEWLRANAKTEAYEAANAMLGERRLRDVTLDEFYRRYPHAEGMPPDTYLFDVLERDDAAVCAAPVKHS